MTKNTPEKRCSTEKEEQSLSSIFKTNFDALYNYGFKISNDNELVKDCIQNLFYRLWKNNINFSGITNLKSYLFKGLRHQMLNALELKHYQITKIEVEDNFQIEFSPEDYLIENQMEAELRKKIVNALNQLGVKQREAIYLRYFQNLEYVEIAEIMNINLQSVKNNVHRGLTALKDLLGVPLFMVFL